MSPHKVRAERAGSRSKKLPCTNPLANHMQKALSLFEKGPLALVAGEGLNPRPLGYEPYDVRLQRLGESLIIALTSADLRGDVDAVLPCLPRLKLSRCVRFTKRFTEPLPGLRNPVVPSCQAVRHPCRLPVPRRSGSDRRPSAFQAGHIPSWRESCECYALSAVAGQSLAAAVAVTVAVSGWSCSPSSRSSRRRYRALAVPQRDQPAFLPYADAAGRRVSPRVSRRRLAAWRRPGSRPARSTVARW